MRVYEFPDYLAGTHRVLALEYGAFAIQTKTCNQHGEPCWRTIRHVERSGFGQEHSWEYSLLKALTR